jgi:signal transduction histidine kinase
MPDGGELRVELSHEGDAAVIRVSDTGSGIPEQNLSNIFDPFFTTKSSGSGLGLSVVLRIVKTYNGRIDVEQSSPAGTTFRIFLPLAAS